MITFVYTLLAAVCDPVIGCITPPDFIKPGVDPVSGLPNGLIAFMNALLKLIFAGAGIWAFFNLIFAGFGFMNAGGDPKNISKSWDKIWQSFLGLLIIVSSFLIAAIMGLLLFKDPTAILQPKIK